MGPGMGTKKNTGGSAFPGIVERPAGGVPGMELRDYFAAKALPLAWALEQEAPTGKYSADGMEPSYAGAAARAYFFADAMLKEREK